MNYVEAAETLLSKNTLLTVFLALIALAVLLILAANGIKAFKELFGKKTRTLETHCREAEERFKAGEKHISENHDNIADLREGQRVFCVALMALLGHELRTSNGEEMEKAQAQLNQYLINRK